MTLAYEDGNLMLVDGLTSAQLVSSNMMAEFWSGFLKPSFSQDFEADVWSNL